MNNPNISKIQLQAAATKALFDSDEVLGTLRAQRQEARRNGDIDSEFALDSAVQKHWAHHLSVIKNFWTAHEGDKEAGLNSMNSFRIMKSNGLA